MTEKFDKQQAASFAARAFLDAGAVHFYAERPFIFTSGWASPVYIDCRRLISYPKLRRELMDIAVSFIRSEIGEKEFEAVAGGETAGIPFAAWISDLFDIPMQYVRIKPKGFARNAKVEGRLVQGQKTLLIDDLATDGRSKVNFCNTLRESGAEVKDVFVLFYYDIFPESQAIFDGIGVKLHSLTTWKSVLEAAKEQSKFEEEMLVEVEKFLDDPVEWSKAHGGVAEERKIIQPFSGKPTRS